MLEALSMKHSRSRKNRGIDEHDVGHRDKSSEASEDLCPPIGGEAVEFEVAPRAKA